MIDFGRITGFDWDQGNTRKNEKHDVAPSECEQIFFNHPLLLIPDHRHSDLETRLHALGKTYMGRRLHITFTPRRDATLIRVISARDMNRKERVVYEHEA